MRQDDVPRWRSYFATFLLMWAGPAALNFMRMARAAGYRITGTLIGTAAFAALFTGLMYLINEKRKS